MTGDESALDGAVRIHGELLVMQRGLHLACIKLHDEFASLSDADKLRYVELCGPPFRFSPSQKGPS